MYTQIDFKDAAGKTIKSVDFSREDYELIVVFEDDTFSVVRSEPVSVSGWYETNTDITTKDNFNPLTYTGHGFSLERIFGESAADDMRNEARAAKNSVVQRAYDQLNERRRELKAEFDGEQPCQADQK